MDRFYFHLRDDVDIVLDEEGREFEGLPAIIAAALQDARSIIGHDALGGLIDLDQRLDVEDGNGALVHRLAFTDAVTLKLPAA